MPDQTSETDGGPAPASGITPTEADIGRIVLYRTWPEGDLERGVITGLDAAQVLVRFGDDEHSQAVPPTMLRWADAEP
ncbi:hypothetical protein [Teichococcus vastitatis]|jgi:hypothetical protein|uniref:DUF1918 domain-containing protein n=1 Tax=Teichococcus vastitatis TaxID=2307076 RepID=A0ABS9W5Z5_9PROT|nr:hypothetical protein [Pseudoroseomonas vastitatis]MCI0754715.1 hypothetical protein [Pseudoroseomonas vastitatis]